MEPNLSEKAGEDSKHKVFARVVTTSGSYPEQGAESVNEKVKVAHFLKEAAHYLHLTDTSGWIATTEGGNEIVVEKSFEENGLSGKVIIHWGPREGGGGMMCIR